MEGKREPALGTRQSTVTGQRSSRHAFWFYSRIGFVFTAAAPSGGH
jgi:hypothetical protein